MATKRTKNKWTRRQLNFMQMLADPHLNKDDEEIAEELKVKPETLAKWRRLPGFQRKVKKMAEEYLGNGWPAVLKALSKEAKNGKVQAMRLFMDYAERHIKEAQKETSDEQGKSFNAKAKEKDEQFDIESLTEKERKELHSAIVRRIKALEGPSGKA